jgi:hypothetical protein
MEKRVMGVVGCIAAGASIGIGVKAVVQENPGE